MSPRSDGRRPTTAPPTTADIASDLVDALHLTPATHQPPLRWPPGPQLPGAARAQQLIAKQGAFNFGSASSYDLQQCLRVAGRTPPSLSSDIREGPCASGSRARCPPDAKTATRKLPQPDFTPDVATTPARPRPAWRSTTRTFSAITAFTQSMLRGPVARRDRPSGSLASCSSTIRSTSCDVPQSAAARNVPTHPIMGGDDVHRLPR